MANIGKLLEYAVYRRFKTYQSVIANKAWSRDAIDNKYIKSWKLINAAQRADFIKFSSILLQYFKQHLLPDAHIYMPSDRAGASGDVADIVVDYTRISIKNNRTYAKSQRPSAFPAQLGLDPYDTELYNISYAMISEQPYLDYGPSKCSLIEYRKDLFEAIYDLTLFYLNKATSDQTIRLFKFLSGKPHYQAINRKKDVAIYDFTNNPLPESLVTRQNKFGHILINFNNGWTYSLRIHTASEKITPKLSLKFDTILVNQDNLVQHVSFIKSNATEL
jgi:hypothetical protein